MLGLIRVQWHDLQQPEAESAASAYAVGETQEEPLPVDDSKLALERRAAMRNGRARFLKGLYAELLRLQVFGVDTEPPGRGRTFREPLFDLVAPPNRHHFSCFLVALAGIELDFKGITFVSEEIRANDLCIDLAKLGSLMRPSVGQHQDLARIEIPALVCVDDAAADAGLLLGIRASIFK